MKKLSALILSLLILASFSVVLVSANDDFGDFDPFEEASQTDEYTQDMETSEMQATTVEETTQTEPIFPVNMLTFDSYAENFRVLVTAIDINKTFYSDSWEGARLEILDIGDPYVHINWNNYVKNTHREKLDSQSYPFMVIKLRIEGYVEDFELFYCAGDILSPDPRYYTTTDYPCESTGDIEYIIYDLSDDCEGYYNQFRFDPIGADEDTVIYLYEMAFFATEQEALVYAGYNMDEVTETEEVGTEWETEWETELATRDETIEWETEWATRDETIGWETQWATQWATVESMVGIITEPISDDETMNADVETGSGSIMERILSMLKVASQEGCFGIVGIAPMVTMLALGIVCFKKKD